MNIAIPHEVSSVASHISLSMEITSVQSESQIPGRILLSQTDQALYQSKHDSRNLLTIFSAISHQKS
jgi:GGDEF domain-containing protein